MNETKPAEPVLVTREGAICVLTLNRPARLNALDAPTREWLAACLGEASSDARCRAIVLTGAGERAFCAGQDLGESAELDADHAPGWMAGWRAYFEALRTCRKPIVVALNGVAAGAGLQTALLGDVRVAVPEARLIMAEVDVGLPAITGAYLLAVHLGRSRSQELVLSGRAMPAEEALLCGLVHEIVPGARLAARARALALELAAKPPVAMRLTLANLRRHLAAGMAEAEEAASAYQTEAVASGEPQRAMAAFLARRRAARAEAAS